MLMEAKLMSSAGDPQDEQRLNFVVHHHFHSLTTEQPATNPDREVVMTPHLLHWTPTPLPEIIHIGLAIRHLGMGGTATWPNRLPFVPATSHWIEITL
jgi:hypothetical protein